MMNLGDVDDDQRAEADDGVATAAVAAHLRTRSFIPHRCHEAIGVLGAV